MRGLITKDMYCLKKNLKIFFSVTIGIMVLSVLFIISSKYGNVARGMAQMQREEKFGNKMVVSIYQGVIWLTLFIIIAFIGIVGLNIIILGLVIYWYRNKMLSQYNSFLNKADEILGGKQIDMRYDESLDSAISERLNRIVEISNMQKEVAEQERL